jgi:hypothetical protein
MSKLEAVFTYLESNTQHLPRFMVPRYGMDMYPGLTTQESKLTVSEGTWKTEFVSAGPKDTLDNTGGVWILSFQHFHSILGKLRFFVGDILKKLDCCQIIPKFIRTTPQFLFFK